MPDSVPDSNKLIQLIRQSRPSDIKYFAVNQIEKDSVKKVSKKIETFACKEDWHILIIRK